MIPAGSRGSAGARPSRPSFGGAMSTPLPSPLSRRTLPAAWRPGCRRETWRRRQLALSNWLSAVERAYAPFGRRRPGRKQRAERGDEGERLVDHYVMLSLGNLDIGRAGRDQALKISGVLGVEELRLRAANEGERRTGALDHGDRIEAPEPLPEMRVEAQRPAGPALGVDRLSRRAAGDEVENEQIVASLRRGEAEPGDDGLERRPDAVLPGRPAGRRGFALVLGREEGRIDHQRRGELIAEIMSEPDRDPAPERVADDSRRPRLERARGAPRLPRLADELAEVIVRAPVRAPHAGECRRNDSPLVDEERSDEAPPVGMRGPAVQEYEPRLAALAPGEGLDLSALNRDERPLGLDRDRALEPRRRRRLLPAKGRERRHGVRFAHGDRLEALRRFRTGRPRPCRRRRTSSPRHSAPRASCPQSAHVR